ncbi:MAG TPA: CBO0543 family protein [Bacillales bacterium]|nr:CBO0543 family protein [Bacillales bacterium]
MKLEIIIQIISILVAMLMLWKFVPKEKLLEAHLSFLFMQLQTWLYGAIVVEKRLIEYPVRFLYFSYRISFVFEFFIFPVISVMFNIHFPIGKRLTHKILYIFAFPTVITIIEIFLEKYTDVIHYLHWAWYWSWLTMLISLLISYKYYLWFFNKNKHVSKR